MRNIVRMFVVVSVFMALAVPASAAHEGPIKGVVDGFHSIDFAAPGCEPGTALWEFSSSGTGKMSHLGNMSYSLTQCTTIDPSTGRFVSSGITVFTAANGDELTVAQTTTSEAVGTPPAFDGFLVEGSWEVTGGTGRFEFASGSGGLSGVGDIPDGAALFGLPDGGARFWFNGVVAYDRSGS